MSGCVGEQVCLFSYGQTGAGKTHTMQGSKGPDGQGIIPRAILKVIVWVSIRHAASTMSRLHQQQLVQVHGAVLSLLVAGWRWGMKKKLRSDGCCG